MGEFFSSVFEWMRDPDNRGAVQAIAALAALLAAWVTGLLKWVRNLFPGRKPRQGAETARQVASGGGVNVGGDVQGDVTTGAGKDRDASDSKG